RRVDHRAPPARSHDPQRRPHATKGRAEVAVDTAGPVFVGHVDERGSTAESDVVVHDVDLPAPGDNLVEQGVEVALVEDVTRRDLGGTTGGGHFGPGLAGGILGDVVDD